MSNGYEKRVRWVSGACYVGVKSVSDVCKGVSDGSQKRVRCVRACHMGVRSVLGVCQKRVRCV